MTARDAGTYLGLGIALLGRMAPADAGQVIDAVAKGAGRENPAILRMLARAAAPSTVTAESITNAADARSYLANALNAAYVGAHAVKKHWPAGGPPAEVREALDALDTALWRVLEVLWPDGGAFPEEIQ